MNKRHGVSPRMYLIVGALLIALPLAGYFTSNWLTEKKKWAEECFRKPVRELTAHENSDVISVDFSPDGRRALSGDRHGRVSLWDVASGRELRRFTTTASCFCVRFFPSATTALAGCGDGQVFLLSVDGSQDVRRLGTRGPAADAGAILDAVVLPDGESILLGGYHGLSLVDSRSGQERWSVAAGRVNSLALAPGGRQALSSTLGPEATVCLWDLADGRKLKEFRCAPDPRRAGNNTLKAVRFLPDGRRFITGHAGGAIGLWDMATGAEIRSFGLREGGSAVYGLVVSPCGRRVAAGGARSYSNAVLGLWDVESGRLVRRFSIPAYQGMTSHYVYDVAFSPTGQYVLSAAGWGRDGSHPELLLWRLPDETGYWLLGTQDAEEP